MHLSRHDADDLRPLVDSAIARYGFAAEHSYDCFRYYTDPDQKRRFFLSSEGYGVMAYERGKTGDWEVFSEPLAPPEARAPLLAAFLGEVFSHAATVKVTLELMTETRGALLKAVPETLRVRRTKEKLLWPVLNLTAYDPALVGSKFKPLRNAQNRFMREHTLDVAGPDSVSAEKLFGIVDRWKNNRPASHRAYVHEYEGIIRDGFRGTGGALVFIVDGQPEAMASGWKISHSDGYYLMLALHSYAHWGLGEILMLEILKYLKGEGYASVDLGGSDEALLAFKKNFGDVSVYETQRFTVVRS